MKFVAFAEEVLGIRLEPAQRVLASVAFDGVQPGDLHGEARDTARALFGDVDEVSPEARTIVAIVKGARIGGSYLFGGVRLLHAALTTPLETLAPGELASGIIVGPDVRLARQTFRFALGAAESVADITEDISAVTADSFVLSRHDGRSVAIECLPATRGGSAVRGRSLVGAVLSEAALFRDDQSVVNDVEVYKALAPRLVRGAQLVLESTPWAEAGLLWELFSANYGAPTTALAVHAPTRLMRTDARTLAMVEREEQRDPDNAAREFSAEFMPTGSGAFFEPATIEMALGGEAA